MRRWLILVSVLGMVVLTVPLVAVAATETVRYYPDSDGWPEASLSTAVPTYGGAMYDIDGNGKEGRRVNESDKGLTETDVKKYHEWSIDVSGLEVTGSATFTVWYAAKDFSEGDDNRILVYLLDCGSTSCSSPLATATRDVSTPDGDGVFAQTTLTFPAFTHTFGSARDLVVRLMVDKDNSDDDMTFAYDTAAYKTNLTLTKVVPDPTTTTTTTAPTTTSTSGAVPTTTSTVPGSPTTTAGQATTSTSAGLTATTEEGFASTTTTSIAGTTTSTAAGVVPPATLPPPGQPDVRDDGGLATEKTSLVVRTTPSQRGVSVAAESVELSPVEGLMVSFLTVAETVRSQILSAVGLGLIMATLLVIGLARRNQDLEEDATPIPRT